VTQPRRFDQLKAAAQVAAFVSSSITKNTGVGVSGAKEEDPLSLAGQ
jgi:hypothetical protein